MRSAIFLALCAISHAEVPGALRAIDLGNRTLKRYSSPLLGSPGPRSTNDCGSTSGSVPNIPADLVDYYYTQIGCSGLYSSMSVDFSAFNARPASGRTRPRGARGDGRVRPCGRHAHPLSYPLLIYLLSALLLPPPSSAFSQTAYNDIYFGVVPGSACKSQINVDAPGTGFGPIFSPTPGFSFSQSCGNVDTCCVVILCGNLVQDCKGMSYKANFKTTLNAGAVTGIVIGSLVGLGLIILCIRAVCCRRTVVETSATYVIAPNPAYGAPQGYQGAPQGYQGAPQGYQGAPQGYQGAPQGYQGAPQYQGHGQPQQFGYAPPPPQYGAPQFASPQFMPQSAPQAWGEPTTTTTTTTTTKR